MCEKRVFDLEMGHSKAAPFVLSPVVGGLLLLAVATPGHALSTVCTAQWAPPLSTPPLSFEVASGPLTGGSAPPCFPTSVSAQVTVGAGANAGEFFSGDIISGAATSNFARTSPESVALGVPGSTTDEQLTLTFSQTVSNPYLFFTYADNNTQFVFSDSFSLVQANNASLAGQTVTVSGPDDGGQGDGFVVQMLGDYSTINFTYKNNSGVQQSVAFTAGAIATPTPGPLPLMGAGVAFGFSRRLRRRIRAGS